MDKKNKPVVSRATPNDYSILADFYAKPDGINSFRGKYAFLSNFTTCRNLDYRGFSAKTVEHHFQAAKTFNPRWAQAIRRAATPGLAKRLGNSKNLPMRKDWNATKDEVMYRLVKRKFRRDPALRASLLKTAGRDLTEGNYWHDNYWGHCYCGRCIGTGENRLGKILMRVRDELGDHPNV